MFKTTLLLLTATMLTGCMVNSRQAGVQPVEMASDYRMRHPILVTNQRAYVPHACGQWGEDLGTSINSVYNKPHFNHACATQHNLAAMIKNPNDLIEPRREGDSDARRRQTVITKYREGSDPSIRWNIDDRNRVSTRTGG
jgi:pilus assembly protein CpaD